MNRNGILAFDLAKKTGWAYLPDEAVKRWPRTDLQWAADGVPPELKAGLVIVEGNATDMRGRFLANAEQVYGDLITVHNPAFIIFEAPLAGGQKSWGNAVISFDTSAMLEKLAYQRGNIPVAQQHNGTIKKLWTGRGDAKKPQMMQTASQRGLRYDDDNVVDAIATLNACILIRAGVRV